MATDLFVKKRWLYVGISQLIALIVAVIICYAMFLSRAEEVRLGKSFYFLVSETDHTEAGAYDVRLDGGAGYLLEYGGREYVALAVYFNGEDGERVQAAMAASGENTRLLCLNKDRLYFKTRAEKENSVLYVSALDCLYGCMQVLEGEISRLDAGATQESSKRTLNILSDKLGYLGKEYRNSYASFAEVCKRAEEGLRELERGTVYARELRYMLCDLSAEYLRLTNAFIL